MITLTAVQTMVCETEEEYQWLIRLLTKVQGFDSLKRDDESLTVTVETTQILNVP